MHEGRTGKHKLFSILVFLFLFCFFLFLSLSLSLSLSFEEGIPRAIDLKRLNLALMAR